MQAMAPKIVGSWGTGKCEGMIVCDRTLEGSKAFTWQDAARLPGCWSHLWHWFHRTECCRSGGINTRQVSISVGTNRWPLKVKVKTEVNFFPLRMPATSAKNRLCPSFNRSFNSRPGMKLFIRKRKSECGSVF